MKNKIRTTIMLALTIVLMIGYTKVEAVLETRPGVSALVNTTVSSFFEKIRGMESLGGVFGLNATFATEGGTYKETSGSNSIDVHMLKNTEWGAIAMMSASNYGAGNGNVTSTYDYNTKIYNITASTTGNMSGVFGMGGGLGFYEYVSAGIVGNMVSSYNSIIGKAENRYVDKYADGYVLDFSRYIPGDATFETKTFSRLEGIFVYGSSPVFERGNRYIDGASSNDLFSFGYANGSSYSNYGSRVGVWSGLGL